MTLLHSQLVASSIRRRRGSMAPDFICDPETGEIVAIIRGGEVFRDDGEGQGLPPSLARTFTALKAI